MVGNRERNRSQHDPRRASGDAGREPQNQAGDGDSHADHQQDGERYRNPDDEQHRQRADQQGGEPDDLPDYVYHLVDVSAGAGSGRFGSEQVGYEVAGYRQHEPKVVPVCVVEIACQPPDGECRGDRNITPCQQVEPGAAGHAVACIFDHAADECQTLGGVQFLIFSHARRLISPLCPHRALPAA